MLGNMSEKKRETPVYVPFCPPSAPRIGDLLPNLRTAPCACYFSTMSANEILEYVKALPPRERRKFFEGVHDLETALEGDLLARRKRPIRWPDAAARRRRISGDKLLRNLVLLAREQERY